jgi:hypothetical protein
MKSCPPSASSGCPTSEILPTGLPPRLNLLSKDHFLHPAHTTLFRLCILRRLRKYCCEPYCQPYTNKSPNKTSTHLPSPAATIAHTLRVKTSLGDEKLPQGSDGIGMSPYSTRKEFIEIWRVAIALQRELMVKTTADTSALSLSPIMSPLPPGVKHFFVEAPHATTHGSSNCLRPRLRHYSVSLTP